MKIISRYLLSLILIMTLNVRADAQDYVPEVGRTVKPGMKVLAVEDRGTHECRMVEYSVVASVPPVKSCRKVQTERIKGYLLVPDMASAVRKCPAVVMLHDHGARFDIGKEKLVRPISALLPEGENDHIARSSKQWIGRNFDGVYLADSLASLGYVVFVGDALYWGERSADETQRWSELTYGDPEDFSCATDRMLEVKARKDTVKALKARIYEGQRLLYDSLMDRGVIWAEKMLRDDIASVRLLKSLPYVDKDNIGAFGFSMGAHRCWMLAAFCKDVRCGVALSWMTTLDREERMKASDYSMAVMPMREQMDFADIGKFLAPKPMLFLSGESDHLFPKARVETAFEMLRGHYSEAPQRLQTAFFEGGHHCGKDVQTTIFRYLDEILK